MDESKLERLLHDEFAGIRRAAPDPEFVNGVMTRIEANDRIALDTRRPLIVGLAFLLGFIVAAVSLANLDLVIPGDIEGAFSLLLQDVKEVPAWHWMVILLPFFCYTLIES